MTRATGQALIGVRVVEIAAGTSVVGAGLASHLPGFLLGRLGAEVVHIRSGGAPLLDATVDWQRPWNEGKHVRSVEEADLPRALAELAPSADIVVLTGSEDALERRGATYVGLCRLNPRLVVARIRPSLLGSGVIEDYELLVHARSGLLTQFRGHREGPVFCDVPVAGVGAALSATAGALACLYERESTSLGGWVETSLYDGMFAILPMIVGRVAHPTPSLATKWIRNDPPTPLSFRCADDRYIQLWFGAKGAYEEFLHHLGDPPSAEGYAADMRSGAVLERSEGWAARFATRDRDAWVAKLAGHKFRCEPVLLPGECLADPHALATGLSAQSDDGDQGAITILGQIADVRAVQGLCERDEDRDTSSRLLSGVRVLDLAAYLAGPVAPAILAELGAEVIKVEPVTGDVHRNVEFMYAAGQRGKRVIAVDLKSPYAARVLEHLFRWSDVVHQNSRVGLAERLGYDESAVRAVNRGVVYSHTTGFGNEGPRALLTANDHLMQALSGVEGGAGGLGQGPTYFDWGAIDVTGGWLAVCAILAGLYARRRTGDGQSVRVSLLGAGLLFKSGAYLRNGSTVVGPLLDSQQTGYGATYRIYRAGDGAWLALVVADEKMWASLRATLSTVELPLDPPSLRTLREFDGAAEQLLESAFRSDTASAWVERLKAAGVLAELVAEPDRAEFIASVFDDPINRQLGRVISFPWGPRGLLEQFSLPVRFGPLPRPRAQARIADLGEDTHAILASLGFDAEDRAKLVAGGTVPRAPESEGPRASSLVSEP